MAYAARTGPFVSSLGSFDTIAELISGHPATLYNPGTTAYAADLGLVVSNGTVWLSAGARFKLAAAAIPVFVSPSAFMANNGVFVIGQAPSASATASFSATSGAGVTMTMSAATLLGTAADVGRVLTILDTTYKYAVITAQSSTTVATVTLTGTLSGLGPFANNAIWLSGSIPGTANTTAFSVPLGSAYANAFAIIPAGAIAAGVPAAAAIYFCQMASTTQGTFFNNVYTTGAPIIPASPTAFATTGPGAYTGLTGLQTGIQITVPGGAMGPNGGLILTALYSNNNSAGAKTATLTFGGTTMASGVLSTNQSTPFYREIWNRGVTNAQVSTAGASLFGAANANPPAYGFGKDTTVAQTVALSFNDATATDWAAIEHFNVEVIPG